MLAPTAVLMEMASFGLGLLLGSFLNVCVARLPEHRSVVRPRSQCPECGAAIGALDNVPLLSWMLLRGRCRACGTAISWRYPAVELATGAWFAVAAWGSGLAGSIGALGSTPVLSVDALGRTVLLWVVGFLLIGLTVMDWRTQTLPDAFTLTGTLLGFLSACIHAVFLAPGEYDLKLAHPPNLNSANAGRSMGNVFLTGAEHLVLGRLLAIVVAAGAMLLIRAAYKAARGREGMGMGDAKLMGMLAALLGLGPAVLAFLVGVVLCAAVAVGMLATGRADRATRLPLGSFLCAGGLFAALRGAQVLGWYGGLF